MATEAPSNASPKQLLLQKIYLKDLSFESPRAPAAFSGNVRPQTELSLRSSTREVGTDTHEITLTLTIEAKDGESTLFLIEIQQAGIFLMQGYSEEERGMLVGSFCPATLYPFAREAVAEVVVKGGFPQLLLQPINFDSLYAQAQSERSSGSGGADGEQRGPGAAH
jgi:preprotein translocase subunit SecB